MAKSVLTVLDFVVKYLVPVGGGLLGTFSFFATRRKEKRCAAEERKDWELFAEIVASSKDGSVFNPEPTSEIFKRADRLRQKGLLEQHAPSGFAVPGQEFKTVAVPLGLGSAKGWWPSI